MSDARGMLAVAGAALALLAFAGCGDDEEDSGADTASEPAATSPAAEAGEGAGDGDGGVKLERVGDFDQPLYVTQPPGSKDLYVVEKPGRVRLVRNGETRSEAVLDISDEVSDSGEQGLLSIAFAPDFADSRLLYAYFTDADQNQRVVEFSLSDDGTSIDPASRRDLLRMEDFASNHNGGLLAFGPDAMLYIGTGDGGIADDPERTAQDPGSLLGKLLRIDPALSGGEPYGIPADNPFADQPGARAEVYSYGLRNPWRFSFDRKTGDLYIGDVGQNSLEEIDYAPAGKGRGANFGWSAFEGTERFNQDQQASNHVEPVLTYGREGGCSVTGGYVVRDPELSSLRGRYLYGDFCEGELRSFVPAMGEARDDKPLDGLQVANLSSFGEDAQGRIYATSLDGPVFRLVP